LASQQKSLLTSTWADVLRGAGRIVEILQIGRAWPQATIRAHAKDDNSEIIGVVRVENEEGDLRDFVLRLSQIRKGLDEKTELHVLLQSKDISLCLQELKATARDLSVHIDSIWEFKAQDFLLQNTGSRSS